MDKLIEITKRAVEDYGFRQIAQWSPEDLVAQWQLSSREAEVLKGPINDELGQLPVPVEPRDYSAVEGRLADIIKKALS